MKISHRDDFVPLDPQPKKFITDAGESRSEEYVEGGLKLFSSVTAYELKFLLLVIWRGIQNKYNFILVNQTNEQKNFYGVAFKYKDETIGDEVYKFLQAKHIQEETKKTEMSGLKTKKNDFSLQEHFSLYLRMKSDELFRHCKLNSFVICSSIDLDESLKRSDFHTEDENDLLSFYGTKKKSEHLKFNSPLGKEGIYSTLEKMPGYGQEFFDEDIKQFLTNLVFAVNQPNEEELSVMIKVEMSKIENINLIDQFMVPHLEKDMFDKNVDFFTPEKGKLLFQQIEQKIFELVMSGKKEEYNERNKSLCIEFSDNTDNLSDLDLFLNQTNENKIFHLISKQTSTTLSSFKVSEVLKKQKKDYIFMGLDSLLLNGIGSYVIAESKKKNSHSVLVIECGVIKENIKKWYDLFCYIIESNVHGGKKVILVTQENDDLSKQIKNTYEETGIYEEKKDESLWANLTTSCQIKLLCKETIKFQGRKLSLGELMGVNVAEKISSHTLEDIGATPLFQKINGELLIKLGNEEEIIIGDLIKDDRYNEVKDNYYPRFFHGVRIGKDLLNNDCTFLVIDENEIPSDIVFPHMVYDSYEEINFTFIIVEDNQKQMHWKEIYEYESNERFDEEFNKESYKESYKEFDFKCECEEDIIEKSWNSSKNQYYDKKTQIHWLEKIGYKYVCKKSYGNDLSKLRKLEVVSRSQDIENITDEIIIIDAIPGMGKSITLSHLARNIQWSNQRWIVQSNSADYMRFEEQRKNKSGYKVIDAVLFLYEIFNFQLFRNFDNADRIYEKSNILNKLIKDDNGEITVVIPKNCKEGEFAGLSTEGSAIMEIELFTHYYNKGQMVLFYDGFDEISPTYKDKAIQILQTLRQTKIKQIWITTDSCNKIYLEDRLGTFSFLLETEHPEVIYRMSSPPLNLFFDSPPSMNRSIGSSQIYRMSPPSMNRSIDSSEIYRMSPPSMNLSIDSSETLMHMTFDSSQSMNMIIDSSQSMNKTIDSSQSIIDSSESITDSSQSIIDSSQLMNTTIDTTFPDTVDRMIPQPSIEIIPTPLQQYMNTSIENKEILNDEIKIIEGNVVLPGNFYFLVNLYEEFIEQRIEKCIKNGFSNTAYNSMRKCIHEIYLDSDDDNDKDSDVNDDDNSVGNDDSSDYSDGSTHDYVNDDDSSNDSDDNTDDDVNDNDPQETKDVLMKTNETLAVYQLFPELYSKLKTEYIKKLIIIIQNMKKNTGLIYKINPINNMPEFIHHSFVEYFTANYFWKKVKSIQINELKKKKKILKIIIDKLIINDMTRTSMFFQLIAVKDLDSKAKIPDDSQANLPDDFDCNQCKILTALAENLLEKVELKFINESTEILLKILEISSLSNKTLELIVDYNGEREKQYKLLCVCANFGYNKLVKTLIKKFEIKFLEECLHRSDWKSSPLWRAAENHHEESLRILTTKYSKCIKPLIDVTGRTIPEMIFHVHSKDYFIFKYCLNNNLVDCKPYLSDGKLRLPILEALIKRDTLNLVDLLVKKSDFDIVNNFQYCHGTDQVYLIILNLLLYDNNITHTAKNAVENGMDFSKAIYLFLYNYYTLHNQMNIKSKVQPSFFGLSSMFHNEFYNHKNIESLLKFGTGYNYIDTKHKLTTLQMLKQINNVHQLLKVVFNLELSKLENINSSDVLLSLIIENIAKNPNFKGYKLIIEASELHIKPIYTVDPSSLHSLEYIKNVKLLPLRWQQSSEHEEKMYSMDEILNKLGIKSRVNENKFQDFTSKYYDCGGIHIQILIKIWHNLRNYMAQDNIRMTYLKHEQSSEILKLFSSLNNLYNILIDDIKNKRYQHMVEKSQQNPDFIKSIVNSQDDSIGSPLHYAVYCGDITIVDYLLTYGANPNLRLNVNPSLLGSENYENWPPLHLGALMGHTEVVQKLITAGSKVDAIIYANTCYEGESALHASARSDANHSKIAQLLLQSGAKYDLSNARGLTPLDLSKSGSDIKKVLNFIHVIFNHAEKNDEVGILPVEHDNDETEAILNARNTNGITLEELAEVDDKIKNILTEKLKFYSSDKLQNQGKMKYGDEENTSTNIEGNLDKIYFFQRPENKSAVLSHSSAKNTCAGLSRSHPKDLEELRKKIILTNVASFRKISFEDKITFKRLKCLLRNLKHLLRICMKEEMKGNSEEEASTSFKEHVDKSSTLQRLMKTCVALLHFLPDSTDHLALNTVLINAPTFGQSSSKDKIVCKILKRLLRNNPLNDFWTPPIIMGFPLPLLVQDRFEQSPR